jgi:hypothetical protein
MQVGGQDASSEGLADLHDLNAKKTALMKDFDDFGAMAQSLQGAELSTLTELNDIAMEGVMELDATISFLQVYRNMQCEPDRATAKSALKNRLGAYSHMLGLEAETTPRYLAFTKLPATAQAGFRMRDELLAAKNKLDTIAASLE